MFPIHLLESVVTSKTYSPDQSGDHAGGLVNIQTKDFPGRRSVRFSLSTSVNTLSSFQTGIGYSGGNPDFLGIDDGTRGLPSVVPTDTKVIEGGSRRRRSQPSGNPSTRYGNPTTAHFRSIAARRSPGPTRRGSSGCRSASRIGHLLQRVRESGRHRAGDRRGRPGRRARNRLCGDGDAAERPVERDGQVRRAADPGRINSPSGACTAAPRTTRNGRWWDSIATATTTSRITGSGWSPEMCEPTPSKASTSLPGWGMRGYGGVPRTPAPRWTSRTTARPCTTRARTAGSRGGSLRIAGPGTSPSSTTGTSSAHWISPYDVLGYGSQQFVAAVSARDTAAMHRLRVTAREHNELLWPELPASQLNMPVGFAWFNMNSRSVMGAARVIDRYGGKVHHVFRTECRKGSTAYEIFTVHGDCWVTLRLEDGNQLTAKLFGSVVEMDGRYKIVAIEVGG